eukprot:gene19293-25939_t
MDMQRQLPQLEQMCERLYLTQSQEERLQVEQMLGVFGQSTEYIADLKAILDSSSSPYAQHMAATSLLKLATEHSLSAPVRAEMKQYFLSYLDNKGPSLQHFVVVQIVQLLTRTVKLGWYENDVHKQIVEDAKAFIDKGTPEHYLLALRVLNTLVRTASVRRSLFASESELFYPINVDDDLLNYLLVRTAEGLADHDNYHEFCRLLGRLKTNYQLSELVAVDRYTEWIQQVADLTISSLNSWQWASSSVYYLLGLWSRLVSSMPYLKGDAPSLLEVSVPQITQAYITSRLESVGLVLQNNMLEDMLENEDQLTEQMDALPYLVRFQYDNSAAFIVRLMEPLCDSFSQAAKTACSAQQMALLEGQLTWLVYMAAKTACSAQQVALLEGQLTWLVYIVGAIIKGRLSSSSAESQESIDGDLAARVFALLAVMDDAFHSTRYAESSRRRLDTAIINFFQCFRKVYIGEQVMHSSKVYTKLQEKLGLTDHLGVLNVMLSKIAKNLQVYGSSEEIVHQTLTLFQDLAAGYMSGKLLMKLDSVRYILSHHTAEHYAFLNHPANTRNRTTFYATLARLLFMDEQPSNFKDFVAPLQQVLVGLAQASNNSTDAAPLRQSIPKETIIGLFRDLRGIATATNSRRTYSLLFDWLYPQHLPVMIKCLEAWADVPQVTTPLLKFMAEFVFNKGSRLAFDPSSPNGILLFSVSSPLMDAAQNTAGSSVGSQAGWTGPKTPGLCSSQLNGPRPKQAGSIVGSQLDDPAPNKAGSSVAHSWMTVPKQAGSSVISHSGCTGRQTSRSSVRLTVDGRGPANKAGSKGEVSRVMVTYGNRVLAMPAPGASAATATANGTAAPTVGKPYDTRYKDMWVCFTMLARTNPALKEALEMTMRLVLSIPLVDIMAFRKVSRAYFSLIEVLAHNHTGSLVMQDTATFTFLIQSMEQGLKCLDVAISSSCASAIDNLAGFYFRSVVRGGEAMSSPPGTQQIAEHIRLAPHLFPEVLKTLFEIVLFEECSNQWSLSRPMLSLILINEQIYNDLKCQIIASQPADRQAHLATCLAKLMTDDVQRNLEPKNRDKFTQILTVVRHEYRSKS